MNFRSLDTNLVEEFLKGRATIIDISVHHQEPRNLVLFLAKSFLSLSDPAGGGSWGI